MTGFVFNYDNLFNRVLVEYEQDATNYTLFENGLNQYSQIDAVILEYDLNGNLVQHGTRYYLYDSENQMLATYNLAGEPNETQVSLYSYDEFGRRISKAVATGAGESTTPPFGHPSSERRGVLTESYLYDGFQAIGEYDESGEYIRRRFIYAAGIDEPIAMVAEPAHQGFFGFDEFSTIATSWLYDSNDIGFNEFADFNSDGIVDIDDLKIFASDFYLDERPLLESPQYYGYAFDGLGSMVAITFCNDPNQTGDPNELPYFVETYEYDAFGTPTIYDADEQIVNQSQIGNPYLFTGRRFDSESGLYYYRFRMYDAELGRFLQTDPIGYYDSMNLYQYCGNNPINFVDPWGLAVSRTIYPVITESDLLNVLQDYYDSKLKDMNNPLRLIVSGGDTVFFDDNTTYRVKFTKNGKKKVLYAKGHSLNYIGVGAGFKKFKLGPFSPLILTTIWNLGYFHLPEKDEIIFAYWGYTNYHKVRRDR